MAAKRCPSCNLVNPGSAMTCDCGYSFHTGEQGRPLDVQSQQAQPLVARDTSRTVRVLLIIGMSMLIVLLQHCVR